MAHFSDEIKREVVNRIFSGDLSLEEAMLIYNIRARLTIINWLRIAQLQDAERNIAQLKKND